MTTSSSFIANKRDARQVAVPGQCDFLWQIARMHSLLPVLAVFAWILLAFSPAFLVPLAGALALDAEEHARLWIACFGLTRVSGLALIAATRSQSRELQPRDGFLLVNLVWLVLPAYTALPLM